MSRGHNVEREIRDLVLKWLEENAATIQNMAVKDYEDLVRRFFEYVEDKEDD